MIYACCNEHRRAAVLGNPALNGIDYLEVLDREAPAGSPRQQTLLVYCLKPAPAGLGPANVYIVGGESITGITAAWVAPASDPPPQALPAEAAYFTSLPDAANALVVRTSVAGDFSPYCLRLVNEAEEAAQDPFTITEALAGFDPLLAEVEFSFKVECGPEFDCAPAVPDCPPTQPAPPPINYLAKDYGSFRTVLLNRLNQLLPAWTGTSEADIGVVLAELLAYVGDQLSYQQDAVATEAYLMTARSRISLRRHALLVDYLVHDGCNARAWVCVTVSAPADTPVALNHTATRFYTAAPGMPANLKVNAGNEAAALLAGVVAFEPMHDASLFFEHNQMQFYTWGDTDCCLPRGATEATLLKTYPNLQAGDVLIFQEMVGPQTGVAADADLRHRCAVRLTAVTTTDGQGNLLVDPLFEEGTEKPITSAAQKAMPITEIRWSAEDALPFPVCISSPFRDATGTLPDPPPPVSAVFGNVVLADQGLTMPPADLPTVPEPRLFIPAVSGNGCDPAAPTALPVRYWPRLAEGPVTQAVPLPLAGAPVTPSAVALVTQGAISLSDGAGFAALTVTAKDPSTWPQYFGIRVTSSTTSGNIDLAVLFCPGGNAPPGMPAAVVLEQFTDLSLTPGTADSVTARINGTSQLVFVPAGYTPPTNPPTTFPAAPTMLSATGPVVLEDASPSHTPYLTLQATNPASWPPLFGVLTQGDISKPDQFNLVLVYQPPDGGVGVQTPVVAEQFTGVQLDSAATQINIPSSLITVQSFQDQPNPTLSASELTSYDAAQAVPAISLASTYEGNPPVTWTAVPNLLGNGPLDTAFVVEVDTDGTAHLRFGDSTNGLFPASGTAFTATYRVGNGTAGNVGADSLTQFAANSSVVSCVNPMPASGGVDPETPDQIRRRAPQAFLTQERAITMTDYATVAEASPQVEDAAATLRWTGSWYTAFITAEPASGGDLSAALRTSLTRYVNRFRLAGQDIQLEGPDYVSLKIKLAVCVDPTYFQSDVRQSLLTVLGSGTLPDGQSAFFAPGRFVLGQTVYLSPIYQTARSVAGVLTVTAEEFQPQGTNTKAYLHRGAIPIGADQVARMDNDPSLPDHGQLTLVLQGGK
jgi:hypothetical protein